MKSPVRRMGGKGLMAKRIIAAMPPHTYYVEVFGGGAHVLCAKPRSKGDHFNDVDGELINFYRCVKKDAKGLIRALSCMPVSEELFYEMRDSSPTGAVERAVRFFYLMRCSFGSKSATWGFSLAGNTALAFRPACIALRKLSKRLEGVFISCSDWERAIQRFDDKDTLFYCDPPYYGTKQDGYGAAEDFTEETHKQLAEVLHGVKGKVLLSYNDVKEVRELYPDWAVQEITEQASMRSTGRCGGWKPFLYREDLLLANYEFPYLLF